MGGGQVNSGPRLHPGVRWLVQIQGGLLQPWSIGHLGWNLAGSWEPTPVGKCPCLGWAPQSPESGALKMGFWGTICPNFEWFAWVWMLQMAGDLQRDQALQRQGLCSGPELYRGFRIWSGCSTYTRRSQVPLYKVYNSIKSLTWPGKVPTCRMNPVSILSQTSLLKWIFGGRPKFRWKSCLGSGK